jgi:hypothetical protein
MEASAMSRLLLLAAATLFTTTQLRAESPAPTQAQGLYVEARTCDVWTGPCFANADFNLSGKNAVMAWKIEKGQASGATLDGLSVVAVIAAHNTLGLEQRAPAKVILLVDERADSQQRSALVAFARQQGGDLLENVAAVQAAPIALRMCDCKGKSCAELDAGVARIKTRCLDSDHDKVCGNESAFHPPLAKGVQVVPAAAEEHAFRGTGLGHTWSDNERRGAYVGSFTVR